MATYAVVDGAFQVVNMIEYDGVAPFVPGAGLTLADASAAPPGVGVGWHFFNGAFTAPPAPDPEPAPVTIRYVPVPLARERLEAAGKWDALVGALATDMPRLIKLLTLADGLDPADEEVRGVLTAIGADPDDILAS